MCELESKSNLGMPDGLKAYIGWPVHGIGHRGAGFIGSHLVDALVGRGKSVRVLDNFRKWQDAVLSHHDESGFVEVVNADSLDPDAVRQAMVGVDVVHHMAANPDIRLGTTVTDTGP